MRPRLVARSQLKMLAFPQPAICLPGVRCEYVLAASLVVAICLIHIMIIAADLYIVS